VIRHAWMDASRIRVIPVVAAWIAMQWDLLGWRRAPAPALVELEAVPEEPALAPEVA